MAKAVNINRRSVRKAIRAAAVTDEPITGTTISSLAECVRARMRAHPSQHRQTIEAIKALMADDEVIHRDAVLRLATSEEIDEMIYLKRAKTRRALVARRRRMTRRCGRLPVGQEQHLDPEWSPEDVTADEADYADWAARTAYSTPPAGGWSDFSAKTPKWDQRLLDACFPYEASFA